MENRPIYPSPLTEGDTVAIVSPASIIDPALVHGAARRLEQEGWRVVIAPAALSSAGSFAGPADARIADMSAALTDRSVRAVLCSRGGYGCVHLLESLDAIDLAADPKWVIGFSDVSAIHALMASHGIVSIHGSMAKALAQNREEPVGRLLSMLRGSRQATRISPHPFNRHGSASGRLAGGNLAVIQALIGTPFDIFAADSILFIEDIAEPIYKVERILYQLHLSGILDRIAGLVIGRFTDYRPSADHPDMYTMIDRFLRSTGACRGIPVAFGAPVGHFDDNLPLLHNARAVLTVTPSEVILDYE